MTQRNASSPEKKTERQREKQIKESQSGAKLRRRIKYRTQNNPAVRDALIPNKSTQMKRDC